MHDVHATAADPTNGRHALGPNSPGASHVVKRNIAALQDIRRREDAKRTTAERLSDLISAFAGSIWFVLLHAVLFGAWLVLNCSFVPLPKWDPYPFVMLAMIASVESIFLSTFILITQNRMQKLADQRAELDLQVSLLAEHELTQVVRLVDAIAGTLGVWRPDDADLADAKRDIDPQKVVRQIDAEAGA